MGDYIMAGVLFAVFAVVWILFCYRGYKKAKEMKRAKASQEKRLEASMSATVKHISGLPVAKGALVEMYYGPKQIVFKKDGQEISVSRDKVVSIDQVFPGKSAQKAIKGAASGKYALGGKIGAAAGTIAAMTPNMVISYVSGGKNKQISPPFCQC